MNEGGEEVGAGFSRELYEGVALCFTLFFFFFLDGMRESKTLILSFLLDRGSCGPSWLRP